MFETNWYVIVSAFILDFLLGDPARLPHPVIYMGRAIDFFENIFRKYVKHLLISGFLFACFLIFSTGVLAFFAVKVSSRFHPFFGDFIQVVLLFFCFSSTSLEKESLKVFHALNKGSIDDARSKLSMIVGRETQTLDETRVTMATVETIAENFVDGFLSPLFFAMIGGAPMALAYKMINTLDSMVGYKNSQYLFFGRTSARVDDAANFIPARISVAIIALSAAFLSLKRGLFSFKTGIRQGHLHKSPNAGYPEAAFAGALKIRLGGPTLYHGRLIEKPYIGKAFQYPEKIKIRHACDLMIAGSLFAALIASLILFFCNG